MPKLVSKDAFVENDDAQYSEIDVKGWGRVRLKSLTGAGRDSYYAKQFEKRNGEDEFRMEDAAARLLALSLCDETGVLWFPNTDEGVQVLREKSSGALQQAFEEAMKLNGLSAEEFDESKKDSTETPNDERG